MMTFSFQRSGEYKDSAQASTESARQYKDATDLVVRGGWNEMDGISKTVVRRLTPLECERLQGFPDGWTLIGEPQPKYDADGNAVEIERYYIDSSGKRKKVSDSARYKALGNSIALPFWFYLLRRIAAQYERPATLGSLFDGLGGFPLCWERCNGEGTALWASEVEEFCIAVTKEHFPDNEVRE